jgi:hypothetical protein
VLLQTVLSAANTVATAFKETIATIVTGAAVLLQTVLSAANTVATAFKETIATIVTGAVADWGCCAAAACAVCRQHWQQP